MNRLCSFLIGMAASIYVLSLPSIYAASLYVDKDNTCPGAGTSQNPYCSIQKAFDAVSAGGTIRIRDAATPYDEAAKVSGKVKSGTPSQPIIVEPDSGHKPILRYTGRGRYDAVIWLEDVDYWTLRNLTFDGAGIETSLHAVIVRPESRHMMGIQILGNTFLNWGGSEHNGTNSVPLIITNNDTRSTNSVHNILIRQNTFDSNRTRAIQLIRTTNSVVEFNEIRHQKCGARNTGVVNQVGIQVLGASHVVPDTGAIIRDNHVYDFEDPAQCGLGKLQPAVGIWCDVNGDNGRIERNYVHHIAPSDTSGVGVLIEARCDNWTVENNIIHDVGSDGIRNANDAVPNTGNTYRHNTIYRANIGINIKHGQGHIVKDNLVSQSRYLAINVKENAVTQGGHIIDYNLYDGVKIGRWKSSGTLDFTSWKKVCGCDSRTINASPQFVTTAPTRKDDLRTLATSPNYGAGSDGKMIGALWDPPPSPRNLRMPAN